MGEWEEYYDDLVDAHILEMEDKAAELDPGSNARVQAVVWDDGDHSAQGGGGQLEEHTNLENVPMGPHTTTDSATTHESVAVADGHASPGSFRASNLLGAHVQPLHVMPSYSLAGASIYVADTAEATKHGIRLLRSACFDSVISIDCEFAALEEGNDRVTALIQLSVSGMQVGGKDTWVWALSVRILVSRFMD